MIRTGAKSPLRLGKRSRVPAPGRLTTIRVATLAGNKARGRVTAGSTVMACALGPRGIARRKREGDGATPAGSYRLTIALVRADRLGRPRTSLPVRRISPADGWCDDAACPLYNRPVVLPFQGRHERLWRDDALYDCVIVIDYNTARIEKGRGSAIFLHVAGPDLSPTAGCVALSRASLLRLLPRLGPETRIVIG